MELICSSQQVNYKVTIKHTRQHNQINVTIYLFSLIQLHCSHDGQILTSFLLLLLHLATSQGTFTDNVTQTSGIVTLYCLVSDCDTV